MIKCKGDYGYCRCVIDMDAQQSHGGDVSCDMAENLNYNRECILSKCEYAEAGGDSV